MDVSRCGSRRRSVAFLSQAPSFATEGARGHANAGVKPRLWGSDLTLQKLFGKRSGWQHPGHSPTKSEDESYSKTQIKTPF